MGAIGERWLMLLDAMERQARAGERYRTRGELLSAARLAEPELMPADVDPVRDELLISELVSAYAAGLPPVVPGDRVEIVSGHRAGMAGAVVEVHAGGGMLRLHPGDGPAPSHGRGRGCKQCWDVGRLVVEPVRPT